MADKGEKGTKIIACLCAHVAQDARYGANNRVHNATGAPQKAGGQWRCTVCGRVRN